MLEQIALMAMQAGIGLPRGETIEYAAPVIDVIVPLDRSVRRALRSVGEGEIRRTVRPLGNVLDDGQDRAGVFRGM